MNVLIVGKSSYIGTHIETWLTKHDHTVFTLNSRTDEWTTYDYSKIDSIIHVAAIVHQKQEISWEMYYKVNTVLPVNIAEKAKEQGVKQFVFLSTMGVYGKEKTLPNGFTITENTEIAPVSYYGKSKREAEKQLIDLEEDSFLVSIVRPPSVYGKDCPGNYISRFNMIANRLPLFPLAYTEARQSFLYIDNLSELIRIIIESNSNGIYTPQDSEQPNTPQLLQLMASIQGKNLRLSKGLGQLTKPFFRLGIIKKLYGGIEYAPDISNCFEGQYQKVDFLEGMKKTLT